jgi:hypothetical protein
MNRALLAGAAIGIGLVALSRKHPGRGAQPDAVGAMSYWSSATIPPTWPSYGPRYIRPWPWMFGPRRGFRRWRRGHRWWGGRRMW